MKASVVANPSKALAPEYLQRVPAGTDQCNGITNPKYFQKPDPDEKQPCVKTKP